MKMAAIAVAAIWMGSGIGMASAQAPAPAPAQTAPVPAQAAPAMGTWKVTGDVQGVPVNLTCVLQADAEMKVTGTCSGVTEKAEAVAGTVKGQTLTWSFNSEYEGSPITITLTGTADATGQKMSGGIYVDPMGADGQFSALLQPATTPS